MTNVAWLAEEVGGDPSDDDGSMCEVVYAPDERAAKLAANAQAGWPFSVDEVDECVVVKRRPKLDGCAGRGAPTMAALIADGWVLKCVECDREVRDDALDYRDGEYDDGRHPLLPEEAAVTDDRVWCGGDCRDAWETRWSMRRAIEAFAASRLPADAADIHAWVDPRDNRWRLGWRDKRARAGATVTVGDLGGECSMLDLDVYLPQFAALQGVDPAEFQASRECDRLVMKTLANLPDVLAVRVCEPAGFQARYDVLAFGAPGQLEAIASAVGRSGSWRMEVIRGGFDAAAWSRVSPDDLPHMRTIYDSRRSQ